MPNGRVKASKEDVVKSALVSYIVNIANFGDNFIREFLRGQVRKWDVKQDCCVIHRNCLVGRVFVQEINHLLWVRA